VARSLCSCSATVCPGMACRARSVRLVRVSSQAIRSAARSAFDRAGFSSVSPGQFYSGRDTGSPMRPGIGMGMMRWVLWMGWGGGLREVWVTMAIMACRLLVIVRTPLLFISARRAEIYLPQLVFQFLNPSCCGLLILTHPNPCCNTASVSILSPLI